jgi:class 3 adenylate cyclase
VTEAAPIDAPPPAYRGFLFSDVRGFTAFAERHGNAEAAAMVGRFLDIARRAIARHQGAEIKTEGDAIHAVFPSASGAVLCGLEIVEAAAEANARRDEAPLNLGVGIHAGEAVETAEGYIGRAVNIAARVCSVAGPGEVLVTSTVKGITQASIPVGFIPRGRRRLKGIQDPIVVYAVSRDANARAPRTVPRPLLAATAAVGVLGLIALVAFAGSRLLIGAGASPTPAVAASLPASPRPLAIGSLSIGTYRSVAFQPSLTVEIVDSGWAASRDTPGLLSLVREADPKGSLFALRVTQVISNPCIEGDPGAETGPSTSDVLDELGTLAHVTVTNRTATQVGGLAGNQAEVAIAEGAQAACGGLVGSGIGVFVAGGEVWRALPGEHFRVLSVGSGSRAVTLVVSADWSEPPSVQQLDSLEELGNRILARVTF